ncbi:MAG: hypothetical protein ACREPX_12050 [Rhodanobacteraceae bacterium]
MKASGGLVAFAGCALAAASPLALAEGQALDPVSIWLGGYYANTEVSVDAQTHDTDISTGKLTLDEDEEVVGRARLDVLLFGSQGLQFDYYTLSHDSSDTLTHPFNYLGIPFELNTSLRSKFDFVAGSAAYHWWFGSGDDVFGVGLGGTYYQAKFKVEGTADAGDDTSLASASWDEDAIAPLITVAWKHAYSDSLRIYFDGSGIYKSSGTLSGHLYDARFGVEWFPWHNAGFAVEYGATRIKLNREGNSYDADLNIKLDGPSLFARFRF